MGSTSTSAMARLAAANGTRTRAWGSTAATTGRASSCTRAAATSLQGAPHPVVDAATKDTATTDAAIDAAGPITLMPVHEATLTPRRKPTTPRRGGAGPWSG